MANNKITTFKGTNHKEAEIAILMLIQECDNILTALSSVVKLSPHLVRTMYPDNSSISIPEDQITEYDVTDYHVLKYGPDLNKRIRQQHKNSLLILNSFFNDIEFMYSLYNLSHRNDWFDTISQQKQDLESLLVMISYIPKPDSFYVELSKNMLTRIGSTASEESVKLLASWFKNPLSFLDK